MTIVRNLSRRLAAIEAKLPPASYAATPARWDYDALSDRDLFLLRLLQRKAHGASGLVGEDLAAPIPDTPAGEAHLWALSHVHSKATDLVGEFDADRLNIAEQALLASLQAKIVPLLEARS